MMICQNVISNVPLLVQKVLYIIRDPRRFIPRNELYGCNIYRGTEKRIAL